MPEPGKFCLPGLFEGQAPRGALYYRAREGVCMVAIRQRDLSDTQLATILRCRLAHALMNGDVDPAAATVRGADHEWWFPGTPDDVHLVAATPDEGNILCYMAFATLPGATPEMTLHSILRPQFEVEDVFGPSIFHGIDELRGVPLTRIIEGRRFFRSRALPPTSPVAIRASAELGVAFYRTLLSLSPGVTAIVGDVEAVGAQANLRHFGLPHFQLADAKPVAATPYPGAVREVRAYPVGLITNDMPAAESRIAAIEAALARPGRHGIEALFALFASTRRVAVTQSFPS
jgi:hypothetical protein